MPWSLSDHPADVLSVFTSFQPGYRLVDGGDLLTMSRLLFSATEGAEGGSSEATATSLDNYITDAEGGTTFVLPPGIQGRTVRLVNNSQSTIQVYGMSPNPQTGYIDTIAPADSTTQELMVNQQPGEASEYWCFAPGLWKQFTGNGNLGPGPQGGIPEAPLNGTTYGRENGSWVPVLALVGGAANQMQGPLILAPPSGVPDPNQAVSWSMLETLAIDEGTY